MRISDWSSDVCSSDLHVDPTVRGPVLAAMTRRRAGQLQISRRLVEARLVGEDADRPAKRSAAVKRALRAAQHFDAIDLVKLEIRLRRSLGDGGLVHIDRTRVVKGPRGYVRVNLE